MESPKLEKSEFKTMLLNALNENLGSHKLSSDPKELEDLVKRVVNECVGLHNVKIISHNSNE